MTAASRYTTLHIPHDLTGEIALSLAPELQRQIVSHREVTLDLGNVCSIDASGVAVLVRALGWASAVKHELSVSRLRPEVRAELVRIGLSTVPGLEAIAKRRARRRPWFRQAHAMLVGTWR